MKKSFPKIIIISLVSAFCFLLLAFSWWKWANQAVTTDSTAAKKTFLIPKGQATDQIIQRLHQEGLIKSSLAFKILLYKEMSVGKLQAGKFLLSPAMLPFEIANVLTHGTTDVWLTIPEGWRAEQIVQALCQADIDLKDSGCQKEKLTALFSKLKEHEGYLFPDTYLLPKDATLNLIIKMMLDNSARKFHPGLQEEAQKKNLDPDDVVILASLVEREVKHSQDRPVIAGILLKRWQNDWPLQVDATVQYALANVSCPNSDVKCEYWPKEITKEDLKINSPYNTYIKPGLPPGPICNPGLAALEAVVRPQDSPYWFYLADSSGQTHFAKTIAEHNTNIAKYLK